MKLHEYLALRHDRLTLARYEGALANARGAFQNRTDGKEIFDGLEGARLYIAEQIEAISERLDRIDSSQELQEKP